MHGPPFLPNIRILGRRASCATEAKLGEATLGVGGSGMREKNWLVRAYEGLYELPVPVALAVMWAVGAVLLSSGALALYLYVSALVRMVLGA